MSSGQAARAWSSTLSPGIVDLVNLTAGHNVVTVTNDAGTAPIWFTVSEPGGSNPQPIVGGSNCFCAASVAGTPVNVRHDGMFGAIVNLVAASVTSYTVSIQEKQ